VFRAEGAEKQATKCPVCFKLAHGGILLSTNRRFPAILEKRPWEDAPMNHQELKNFILETYPASADHPWLQYPNYEVFRHNSNQKWFAVVMELPKSKLGLQGEERMDVVNLKCDPILTGSLLTEKGFFPAYHMRKDSWITAALDGTVSEEQLKLLLDMSYRATAPKVRRRKIDNMNLAEGNDE